jgi:thiamine biosynthesis lipoprotein
MSIASLALAAGCGDRPAPEFEFSGPTMGTAFSVKVVGAPPGFDFEKVGNAITAQLEAYEQRTSTYRADSELALLNATLSTSWITVSKELCDIVARAIAMSRYTHGAFDVTVGPLVMLWGFGPDGSRDIPPGTAMIAEARSSVGYDKIATDCERPAIRKTLPGVSIDLSAFAKGDAVDVISSLLDEFGAGNYLVEIGGELFMRGHNAAGEPWAIAIEKPDALARSVQTVINVTNLGMATSGDYRNYFEYDGVRYSHTIDSSTGRPVTHNTAAVTVVGATSADADALATALLVMGEEKGMTFAEDEEIAAYFLLRVGDGVEERASTAFEALVAR